MNNKMHNRTLFVAALSVYLGLLIVGAPPQVLAQQSKAIVQSKSENSSDCSASSPEAEKLFAKEFFVKALDDFLADVETLSKIGKFSPNAPYRAGFSYLDEVFVDENNRARSIYGKGASTENRWLATAFRDFEEKFIAEIDKSVRLYAFRENQGFAGARHEIKFELAPAGFTAQVSFETVSPEKAQSLADLYNSVFALGICRETPRKVFYENTKASFENNQVFIVTRLPRAGLDSLVKADEKAN